MAIPVQKALPPNDIVNREHENSLFAKRVTGVAGQNSDYYLEVGKGNIEGADFEFLTGDNTNVGTTETVLRQVGGVGDYPFPATSAQWFMQSDDATDDTAAGTGARSVFIELLLSDFSEVFEVVDLEGTTSVQLTTNAFRVNNMSVLTAGGDFQNNGVISLTTLTAGAGDILSAINATEGQARQPVRTVPLGRTWFPLNFYPSSGKADDIDVRAVAFSPGPIPDRRRLMFSKNFIFEGTFPFKNDTRIQFPQGFDLEVLAAKSTGSSSGRVGIILEFISLSTALF